MRGPCRSCVNSGHTDALQACSGLQTVLCPSRAHPFHELGLDSASCPECITECQGRRCLCGAVWLCDACSVADYPDSPHLISCPRCGATYCTKEDGCRYCYFCSICRRTDICFGCQSREKVDVEAEDISGEGLLPLNRYERCLECRLYMCNECCSAGKDGVAQCLGCQHWMCRRCSEGRSRCYSCFLLDLF
ncbi:hypothetical protein OG21DRAFT_148352 [Imleria badia]|nr:hypothetical protein OG21DRAFT_148352 [Imleria badia]